MLEPESRPMRLFRAAGMERVAWALRRLHCPVSPDALVLEVGSGGNPYARANVLLDAYESTRERYWVPLKIDRPAVLGFVEHLPFRDKVFDFAIASHVLEHSPHPEKFLAELQRVAHAGYIETPDAFVERVNPYRDHRLEVAHEHGKLLIRKKQAWIVDEDLVSLYEPLAKRYVAGNLIPNHPFSFHVRYYWQDKIDFKIINPGTDATWDSSSGEQPPHGAQHAGIRGRILDVLRYALSQRARNRQIDLQQLLRCPACLSDIIVFNDSAYLCKHCDARYPLRNGIADMHTASTTTRMGAT